MQNINIEEVMNRFAFHPADTPGRQHAHDEVRGACQILAETLVRILPDSREASCALTALQETCMWANAAVAIHGEAS